MFKNITISKIGEFQVSTFAWGNLVPVEIDTRYSYYI